MRQAPRLLLVVPCLNEAEALPHTVAALRRLLETMTDDGLIAPLSSILCIDDGSTDGTWKYLSALANASADLSAIRLTRNCGQQNAIMAGLMAAMPVCDAAITLDADLQDDPSVIPEMVRHYRCGDDIVYGVRRSRRSDSMRKRMSARMFYKLRSSLTHENIPDHSDFRLLSATSLRRLARFSESGLYLRGLMPLIGGRSSIVHYDRAPRRLGKTKYPPRRMVSLALDGITSFSSRPIRAIFLAGLIFLMLDIVVSLYVTISHFSGHSYPGWTSIMLSVWFLGSMMLIAIGIVGEYIGKIFIEVKQRPRYLIEETAGHLTIDDTAQ